MAQPGIVFPNEGNATPASQARVHPKHYQRYYHYYRNKGDMYTRLQMGLEHKITRGGGLDGELRSAIKSLRNPVHRVCEFYATTMLVGTARQAFPLGEGDRPVRDAVQKFWRWSNLDVRKQVLKRWLAIYGHLMIKVFSLPGVPRVQMQLIKPEHITDFDKDDRGNIVYVRLDIPYTDPELQITRPDAPRRVHTEIWRRASRDGKREGYCKIWQRDADAAEDTVVHESRLPDQPDQVIRLVAGNPENGDSKVAGFDFVPFVDVVAQDVGEKRPEPIYDHALGQVNEIAKMVTRYHDLLFLYNKPHRAIQGIGNDPSGRPLAPPEVKSRAPQPSAATSQIFGGERATLLDAQDGFDLTLGGDIMFGLPGNAVIADITPNLNYVAMKDALLLAADEMEQELPELLYFKTLDKAEISGRALRLIMAGAIDRTFEMRSNIENTMLALDKMALTIGQVNRLQGFDANTIGTYNNGDGFYHEFEDREILAISDLENEELRGRRIANAVALMQLGIPQERAFAEVGLRNMQLPDEAQAELDEAAGNVNPNDTDPNRQQGQRQATGAAEPQELEAIGRRLASNLGTFGSSRN